MSQISPTSASLPVAARSGHGSELPAQYLTFALAGEMFAVGILNVKEIIEKFDLRNQIRKMAQSDVLNDVIEKFVSDEINLSPNDSKGPDGRIQRGRLHRPSAFNAAEFFFELMKGCFFSLSLKTMKSKSWSAQTR